jgi:hypothetical protein
MNDNGGGAFPVLGFRMYRDKPLTVPWDFLAPHEAQAQRNHSQTLKRLAERGIDTLARREGPAGRGEA